MGNSVLFNDCGIFLFLVFVVIAQLNVAKAFVARFTCRATWPLIKPLFSSAARICACLQQIVAARCEAVIRWYRPAAWPNDDHDNARTNCASSRCRGIMLVNKRHLLLLRTNAGYDYLYLTPYDKLHVRVDHRVSNVAAAVGAYGIFRDGNSDAYFWCSLTNKLPLPKVANISRHDFRWLAAWDRAGLSKPFNVNPE